jgi:hypothetical protein
MSADGARQAANSIVQSFARTMKSRPPSETGGGHEALHSMRWDVRPHPASLALPPILLVKVPRDIPQSNCQRPGQSSSDFLIKSRHRNHDKSKRVGQLNDHRASFVLGSLFGQVIARRRARDVGVAPALLGPFATLLFPAIPLAPPAVRPQATRHPATLLLQHFSCDGIQTQDW